ncbi:MAG: hypothetical protein A2089_11490 [Elusimicrobia bacterium GWD2_63_28]|nr:MAG: hypothetical protein A2089_11490 [Elusimicrobia bacterium GWD2_63_28]
MSDLRAGAVDGLPCRGCDLTDYAGVKRLLRAAAPGGIYHLAGVFSGDYTANYRGNFLPAKHLLDAALELGLQCRVLLVGSAAEYGAPAKNPVPETAPLNPVNFYGFAKTLQTRLGEYYSRVYGLDIVTARVFNLTGPGVSEALFPGRVGRQIAEYKGGKISSIKVGRLDSWRDYLPVEEAAAALAAVMARGAAGEVYNVGSGRPVRMKTLLADLLARNGVPYTAVESSPGQAGRLDVNRIYADTRKLNALKARR